MGKSRLVAAALCIQYCILAAIVACGIGGSLVSASSARIFYTGVDSNGALLPVGSVDPHYTLVSSAEPDNPGPNAYTASLADTWLPDGPNSRWITPLPATKLMGVGDYDYRTTFDLTGLNPASVQLQGQWTTDNAGQAILLNGSNTGTPQTPTEGFATFHSFAITSGFVPGVNTLDFLVHNGPGGSINSNPTGLRAELNLVSLPPPPPKLYGILAGSTDVSVTGPLHVTVDGQGDAQAMDAALRRFPSFAASQTESFYYPDTVGRPLAQFKNDVSELGKSVKDGDTLVFFYSGHGAKLGVGANSALAANNNDTDGLISATEVEKAFKNDTWTNVNKLLILDSCFSGAFAQTGQAFPGSLPHTAVLAATDADGETGTVSTIDPSGEFTAHVLKALALKDGFAAADTNHDGLTFDELTNLVAQEVSLSNAYEGYLKDEPGVQTFQPSLYAWASPDFGTIATVPEPSTGALVVLVFVMQGRFMRRRTSTRKSK